MLKKKIIDAVKRKVGIGEKRVYDIAELDLIAEYAEDMDAYFNVQVDEKMTVPMILIGRIGIHVFIDLDKNANFDQIRPMIQKVVYKYHLDPKTTFWGISDGLNEVYIISKDGEFIKIDDLVSDFENFYINSKRPEVEIKRLNLKTEKDFLKTEDEINELKKEYENECINLEDENFVREILSEDMVLYYKNLLEKNKNGCEIRTDEEGNEYIKHETKMKILGLATGEAYYRMSDEDAEKTLYITLFGGLFGLHHLLRGDFFRAIIYLFTGGGFGILYIADVISVCVGAYFYDEVRYGTDENGRQTRKKERVYLRPVEDKKKRILGIFGSVIIGIMFTICVIKPGYTKINSEISAGTNEAASRYIEQKYNEIIEYNNEE